MTKIRQLCEEKIILCVAGISSPFNQDLVQWKGGFLRLLQEQMYPHDRMVPKISCHVWLLSVGVLNFLNNLSVISHTADAADQQPDKTPASGGCFSLPLQELLAFASWFA